MHARRTEALCDMARYYEVPLFEVPSDVDKLVKKIEGNFYHQEVFVYGIYFAAWIREEIHKSKRKFANYSNFIWDEIAEGNSFQSMLFNIV